MEASGTSTITLTGSCDPATTTPVLSSGSASDAASCSTSSTHKKQQSFTTLTCATCNQWECLGGSWDGDRVDHFTCESGGGSYECVDVENIDYVSQRVCEQPQERQSIEFNNYQQDLVTVESTQKMGGRIEPEVTRVCAIHIRQGSEDSISHIHAPAGFNWIDCKRLTDTQYLTPSSTDYQGVRYALMCIKAGWGGFERSPWALASENIVPGDRPDCGW